VTYNERIEKMKQEINLVLLTTARDDPALSVKLARAADSACIDAPIPMLLWCPTCGERHLDVGEFETNSHHTHACQGCGMVWRPAIRPTIGVRFLPGFKNEPA
jgi:hypothetical protein